MVQQPGHESLAVAELTVPVPAAVAAEVVADLEVVEQQAGGGGQGDRVALRGLVAVESGAVVSTVLPTLFCRMLLPVHSS